MSKRIVCGIVPDGYAVVVPRVKAAELALLNNAIWSARTWGQLRRMCPPARLDELVALAAQAAEWSGEELRTSEWSHFEPDLPGVSSGDWPEWPAQDMIFWLPREIQDRFGRREVTMFNGPFLTLDPERVDELMAALRELGYEVERDDDLVLWACGGVGEGIPRARREALWRELR